VIEFSVEGRVARIVLQRASASNAFTGEMLEQLLASLARATDEADVLAISAAGSDFSLGRDRQDVKAGPPPFEAFKLITDVNTAMSGFPGVAVCSVQGRAYGFAVGMVMRSDIALAADGARFMLDEVKLGIPPMFILAEMRGFLGMLEKVSAGLARNDFDAVAGAVRALGEGEGRNRMPPAIAKKLPPVFRTMARSAHEQIDALGADAARRDSRHTLEQVSRLLATCNSCHAAFRFPN
jgi:enoyl-CoA hydratase/carnithine racemase